MITTLKNIFSRPLYVLAFAILVGIFAGIWWYFTDFLLMEWNYWKTRVIVDAIFSWINIIGFSLFIVAWVYRTRLLAGYADKKRGGIMGFFAGFLSILISGSMCCGAGLLVTVGASFGANVFSEFVGKYFPFDGQELKLLGIIILLWSLYHLLSNIGACKCTIKKSI